MIWSTFVPGTEYWVVLARSESGRIAGPWTQEKLLYQQNGGHGMLFRSFEGDLLLALHQPNDGGRERMRLLRVTDAGETLEVEG